MVFRTKTAPQMWMVGAHLWRAALDEAMMPMRKAVVVIPEGSETVLGFGKLLLGPAAIMPVTLQMKAEPLLDLTIAEVPTCMVRRAALRTSEMAPTLEAVVRLKTAGAQVVSSTETGARQLPIQAVELVDVAGFRKFTSEVK